VVLSTHPAFNGGIFTVSCHLLSTSRCKRVSDKSSFRHPIPWMPLLTAERTKISRICGHSRLCGEQRRLSGDNQIDTCRSVEFFADHPVGWQSSSDPQNPQCSCRFPLFVINLSEVTSSFVKAMF
jgi:hypothetical protein